MITDTTVSSDEVVINAPIETVWAILVDFESYGKWNRFCPQAKAKLELGSPIEMMVDLGFGLQEQTEYITLIEPNQAIAWGMENKPDDPIHAVRTQRLGKLDDHSCTYISVDEFAGPGVPDMIAGMGKAVEDGFNLCAQCLKEYAESLA